MHYFVYKFMLVVKGTFINITSLFPCLCEAIADAHHPFPTATSPMGMCGVPGGSGGHGGEGSGRTRGF